MAQFSAYVICATARSGTTLLCGLLAGTGVAGKPDSFFRRQSMDDWIARFGLAPGEGIDFDRRYMAAAIREGTGSTGIFGLRLMWPSMADLGAMLHRLHSGLPSDRARFEAAFGPTLFVHVSRGDKLAQAVSRLKAEQTGLWHRNADGSERERAFAHKPAVYDADALTRLIDEAKEHDSAWNVWFAAEGIEPLRVTYEELSADPQAVLRRILTALGCDPGLAETVPVGTAKLADPESRGWIERYVRERGRPSEGGR